MKKINKIADLVATTKIPPHLFVAATSWLCRLLSAFLQIISIRYLIQLLGIDNYAVFTLISALIAWIALTDMGIGTSLQNYITEYKSQEKSYADWIASAGICCFILLGVFLLLAWPIAAVLSTHYLKNATLTDNSASTVYLSLVLFGMTCIGGVSYKIWFAEHNGWIANLVQTAGTITGLILVISLGTISTHPSLTLSIFLYYLPTAIIPTLVLAGKTWSAIKECRISALKNKSIALFKRGSGFWLFSVVGTITLQTDYIVISQKLSSNDIIAYGILTKIFSFILILYAALLQAAWPALVEMRINKKFPAMKTAIRRYIAVGMALALLGIICFIGLKDIIIHTLTPKHALSVSLTTILIFGFYLSIRIYSDTYAMVLQSLNKTNPLWIITPIQAIIGFLCQWNLADHYGINGILIGLCLSFILTAIPGLTFFTRKEFNNLRSTQI